VHNSSHAFVLHNYLSIVSLISCVLCVQAVGMKRDLEAQVNELQGDLSREQTEVSRLRDHNSQLRNQLSDKENKQVKVRMFCAGGVPILVFVHFQYVREV